MSWTRLAIGISLTFVAIVATCVGFTGLMIAAGGSPSDALPVTSMLSFAIGMRGGQLSSQWAEQ